MIDSGSTECGADRLLELDSDTTMTLCGTGCRADAIIFYVTTNQLVTVSGGSIGLLVGCAPVSCGTSLLLHTGERASITPASECSSVSITVE